MAKNHQTEIDALVKQINGLQKIIAFMAKKNELEKMLELIKVKKGWTTPAEMLFATSMVSQISREAKNVQSSITELVNAAKLVQ